jgi:ferritin-like metal-binding protein YciE
MTIKTLEDAFVQELQDILHAEKQLVKALPKMARAASNPDLREAFASQLEETETHLERLQQTFEMLERPFGAKKCEGMVGIIEEGQSLLSEEVDDRVRDAMLIEEAQKVEHYKIAAYGTLCTWAETLGHEDVYQRLQDSLDEEKAADLTLTELALQVVNPLAVHLVE